jgi:hypothetical protein
MTLATSARKTSRRSLLLMASALNITTFLRMSVQAGVSGRPPNASSNDSNIRRSVVLTKNMPQAKLATIAAFPRQYFLESMAIRRDNSILVGVMNHQELWYIPPRSANEPVDPQLIHHFAQPTMGIVEVETDIFYICTSNLYTSHESYLQRLDMRDWVPGKSVSPEVVLEFPKSARGLNGVCQIAANVILVADCFASLIWRVDLAPDGDKATARVWLKHDSMDYDHHDPTYQPGVNGLGYAKANHLYYTSTNKELFMRVRIDPNTHDPASEPEFVAGGMMGDDFCIDDNAGVAYVATHRQNTIDRVALEPSENSNVRHSVAGDPFTEQLIGPTNGRWGRGPGDYGRVAYFLTDGGTKSPPPDGIVRPASVLRVELQESAH